MPILYFSFHSFHKLLYLHIFYLISLKFGEHQFYMNRMKQNILVILQIYLFIFAMPTGLVTLRNDFKISIKTE